MLTYCFRACISALQKLAQIAAPTLAPGTRPSLPTSQFPVTAATQSCNRTPHWATTTANNNNIIHNIKKHKHAQTLAIGNQKASAQHASGCHNDATGDAGVALRNRALGNSHRRLRSCLALYVAAIAGSKNPSMYILERNAYATDELAGEALACACAVSISFERPVRRRLQQREERRVSCTSSTRARSPRNRARRDGLAGNSEISRARRLEPRRTTTMTRHCTPTR